jgi:hypothetical protein
MPRGRNLITTMSLAAAIVVLGARAPSAQEQPPDPRMLLDLDLFASPSGASGEPAALGGGSMLDQIRTLTAMGYLNGHRAGGPWPVEAGTPPSPPQMARPETPPDEGPLPPNTSVIPPAGANRHIPSESQDENEE